MRRVAGAIIVSYLALALAGHSREQRGVITCHCAEDCWCKQAPLSLFRWVLPLGHRVSPRFNR